MPTEEARRPAQLEAEDRVTHVTIDHTALPGFAYEVSFWAGEDGPHPVAVGDDYLDLRAGLETWKRGGRYPVKADTVAALLRGRRMPDPIGWTDPTLDTAHLDAMTAEQRKRLRAKLRRRRKQRG